MLFVSFVTFLCFLVCSQTLLHLFCFVCFICFGGPIRMKSKNRQRFASKVGHLRYFMGLSCKVKSPWRIAARSALARPARTISPLRKGREQNGRQTPTVAPSSFFIRWVWELTHICFEIFFLFFRSFLIEVRLNDIEVFKKFQLFYKVVKCW